MAELARLQKQPADGSKVERRMFSKGAELAMDTTLVGRDAGRELIEMLSLCRPLLFNPRPPGCPRTRLQRGQHFRIAWVKANPGQRSATYF